MDSVDARGRERPQGCFGTGSGDPQVQVRVRSRLLPEQGVDRPTASHARLHTVAVQGGDHIERAVGWHVVRSHRLRMTARALRLLAVRGQRCRRSPWQAAVVGRYAGAAPYETGMLDVGDGQRIYWEQSGNPAGKPVVMLHGGPGGAPKSGMPSAIDPAAYRVVRFHQRGCGRSTPHAGAFSTSLETNTTQHLIGDMELLRAHLGIDRWLVHGGSWGVTLGLAYAQAFPSRVSEMLLVSVTLTRAADVRWFAHETGRFFPEQWARFRAAVPDSGRGDLVAVYDRLINHDPDLDVRRKAAHDWCDWEDAIISLDDAPYQGSRTQSEADLICFARLVTHYFAHAAFLADDQLLNGMPFLADIPAMLIHGRFDLAGPPDVPWLIAQHWPTAQLRLVRSGHTGNDDMTTRIVDAYEAWKPT
jgi:proline iminopeptidase